MVQLQNGHSVVAPRLRLKMTVFSGFSIRIGSVTLKAWVLDSKGIYSDTLSTIITVKPVKPTCTIIAPDSTWYKDSVTFRISAKTTNSTIAAWAFSNDGSSQFAVKNDSIFSFAYIDTGLHTLRAYVLDSKGFYSDTATARIYVRQIKPEITLIKADTSAIYFNDSRSFTIKGQTHGSIDSIFVSWNGTSSFTQKIKAVKDSALSTHTFALSDTGTRCILFRIIDKNGFSDDSTWCIDVKADFLQYQIFRLIPLGNIL